MDWSSLYSTFVPDCDNPSAISFCCCGGNNVSDFAEITSAFSILNLEKLLV